MNDNKFGVHGLWILPVALTLIGVQKTTNWLSMKMKQKKIRSIRRKDPEIERICKDAGLE